MTSTTDDRSKPVTGYPIPPQPSHTTGTSNGYPPSQPNYTMNSGYPATQPNYHTNTTGVAYPYAAPPPSSTAYYNHSNPYPYPSHYNLQRTTFLRRLIIAGIAVFLIFGSITFILWLVLRPHLPEFRVESATVSPFNISASQVTANWDVGIFVRNPNKKMKIYYDRVEASVFYRSESLSQTSLMPFYQGKKNQTTVRARFASLSTYVDSRAASEIANDRTRGSVRFNIRLVSLVRFKAGAWRTRRHYMRVFCEGVTIGFSSNSGNGTLSGGSRQCEVDI